MEIPLGPYTVEALKRHLSCDAMSTLRGGYFTAKDVDFATNDVDDCITQAKYDVHKLELLRIAALLNGYLDDTDLKSQLDVVIWMATGKRFALRELTKEETKF